LFCYRGHCAAVLCVQFDDQKIVSGSSDNTIKVKISLSVFPYSKSNRMFFFFSIRLFLFYHDLQMAGLLSITAFLFNQISCFRVKLSYKLS